MTKLFPDNCLVLPQTRCHGEASPKCARLEHMHRKSYVLERSAAALKRIVSAQ